MIGAHWPLATLVTSMAWRDRPFEPKATESKPEFVSLADTIDTPLVTSTRPRAANERRHRRVAIPRAKACVQQPNGKEEFVELVDVSRGGASFRSEKVYALGSWIGIAAPCTVGASNIFVRARVVRARKADVGREYGVEYVNTGT